MAAGRLLLSVALSVLRLSPGDAAFVSPLSQSVLRLLASNDTNAFRQMRKLNPALLDSVTWPEYLWEWLGIMLDVNTAWMYEQTDQAADDAPLGSRAVSGIEQGAGAPMAVDEANGAEAAASTRETAENDEEERLRAAAARAGVRERKAAAERLFAMKQADPEAFKCLVSPLTRESVHARPPARFLLSLSSHALPSLPFLSRPSFSASRAVSLPLLPPLPRSSASAVKPRPRRERKHYPAPRRCKRAGQRAAPRPSRRAKSSTTGCPPRSRPRSWGRSATTCWTRRP